MKRNRIQNRCIATCLTLIAMLLTSLGVNAQNVTISPHNGSMICALTENQLGFASGAFATWRHEQLALTMTASSSKLLTDDGQLQNHANHFQIGSVCTYTPALGANEDASYFIDCGWGGTANASREAYFTISLPKGYRFTSYKFDLTHDISDAGQNGAFEITTNTTVSMSETGSDFGTAKKSVTLQPQSSTVVTLTDTRNDMGNILYFRTNAPETGYFDITFRYVELTFTADADAEITLVPGSQTSTGHSLVDVPFNTGKVDLGEINPGTDDPAHETRMSYIYNNVTDMSANMLLYEYESTKTAEEGDVLDGTEGLIAYNKTTGGSITTNGSHFRFAPSSDKSEQVYVLESPVSATMSNGTENPVQFRITEAKINYTKQTSSNSFYITYNNGNTKYYLGTNGRFSSSNRTAWEQDENGRIHSGDNYLTESDNYLSITNSSGGKVYTFNSDNHIKNTSGKTLKFFSHSVNYSTVREGYFTNNSTVTLTGWGGYTTAYNVYPAEIEYIAGSSVSNYTIYVYDKNGENPQEINVKGTDYVELKNLNNDAIMFGVKGGDVALLNFDLKLQALNPYIDQMTVVLNDNVDNKNIRMTQTFTADDFSVGGGTFRFYLPTDCINDYITITFEDLYSKYGDNTYDHTSQLGTSDSRYSFVKSQHYEAFTTGTRINNIYDNKPEAVSNTLESARLKANNGVGQYVRTKVGTVGNIAFRFNNADELATNEGYLTEYPFTEAKYYAQSGIIYQNQQETSADHGEFITAAFQSDNVQTTLHDRVFYVFTTDETRYNIAPTTATQHRFYAFYAMKVEVVCQDYSPTVTFNPVYDNTFYGEGVNDKFFGATVSVNNSEVTLPLASDVATYKALVTAIKERVKTEKQYSDVSKVSDDEVVAEMKKILYLDMSGLNGVYHSTASEADAAYAIDNFNVLKNKLSPNALVFLPINSTATYDNFAYAKKGEVAGSFQSANNIVLTDKYPFYTPYTIQVDAKNYATYKRLKTAATEGLVKKATIIMPFDMEVDAHGIHKNPTDAGSETGSGFQFCLRELKQLQTQAGTDQYSEYNTNNDGKGNFMPITPNEQGKAPANKPYMVEVLSDNGTDYSFIATQKGSNIIATPASITGETVSINGNTSNTLTNTGTYSGISIPKENNVYYFTRGMYVSSLSLAPRYTDVYVLPFRAYYVTPTANHAKQMSLFEILYDEPLNNFGIATDIISARPTGPLTITTGKAFMLIKAAEDVQVKISSVNGVNVGEFYMNTGEQKQISLPSGIYIVNNTKIIVK